MSSQIIFFRKSEADLTNQGVSASASNGTTFANYALTRNNLKAWMTTGSVDADGTTWTVDFSDTRYISELLLIKHNFKAFTVKYWNGSSYVAFSSAISESVNTKTTNWYSVIPVLTSKIQITITGTQVADSDKQLYQFIATNKLGQFSSWPVISKPVHSRNKKTTLMLSGKTNIAENVGAFSFEMSVGAWTSDADLSLLESLYDSTVGFLVWLCGGNEDQFLTKRIGYRKEDIYLMKCLDNYTPEYLSGIYTLGLKIKTSFTEVT